jgi:hypothetical protein
MTFDEIREQFEARPFTPFRVITSDGSDYEVRHPEMGWLTRSSLLVGLEERDRYPARYKIVSLLHVTTLEPLPQGDTAPG